MVSQPPYSVPSSNGIFQIIHFCPISRIDRRITFATNLDSFSCSQLGAYLPNQPKELISLRAHSPFKHLFCVLTRPQHATLFYTSAPHWRMKGPNMSFCFYRNEQRTYSLCSPNLRRNTHICTYWTLKACKYQETLMTIHQMFLETSNPCWMCLLTEGYPVIFGCPQKFPRNSLELTVITLTVVSLWRRTQQHTCCTVPLYPSKNIKAHCFFQVCPWS